MDSGGNYGNTILRTNPTLLPSPFFTPTKKRKTGEHARLIVSLVKKPMDSRVQKSVVSGSFPGSV
jgi:hypothetical protein